MEWTKEKALKYCVLLGSKGDEAQGYLDGLRGEDPKDASAAYEEGWLQGSEHRAANERTGALQA